MAKDIIEVSYCDNHGFDAEVPGTTRRLDLGDGPHEIELCDPCYVELIERLRKIAVDRGRRVENLDGDGKKKLRCPFCRDDLTSPVNLNGHVNRRHPDQAGVFLESLVQRRVRKPAETPPGTPAAPEKARRRQEKRTCRECGRVCESPQGLGAHMRTHGVAGSSESTIRARQHRQGG